ncbi:aminodeoxychorismate synthase component I [Noviherbaspirillum aridicola]|uniref:Para-aminobenzoate synthase n=1 Tax=Noviherbaspirillum aridicola TaxID=2849687 RepID=A0ABQ4Q0T7_9BURK|nr:aminodeoxychorismate synthase component I [Noviherbaspirillum aridicola]GIZ50759.1 para-aminobenzoate synthase [Noviherbaspirillum aridicola]
MMLPACYALLDDAGASEAEPRSRLYTGYLRSLCCSDGAALPALLAEMEAALGEGQFAVGLFDYELGARMHGIADREGHVPQARILLFERCEKLSARQAADWLARHDRHPGVAGIGGLETDTGRGDFEAAIARIHDYIAAGDTYQVNFSLRLRFDAWGDPLTLYRRLRERQPVPYGALIGLPEGGSVLSLSPELFIRCDAGLLTARPMKGTAAASGDADTDTARAEALAADAKNRAENLMIVDLLRNDLGRIAEFGSVQVPDLFRVERYRSVLQMTSTVHARRRADAGLAEVFAALYPCGSITGAPKRRTMQIIRELESSPRGLYTGAIGCFDAGGDFCLSVPIRTLRLRPPDAEGLRRGELGVGAGIVHDSRAADEYAECLLKARFLTGLPQDFELFETMHAETAGIRHLDRHLRRLADSARYFGFSFDEAALRARLEAACAGLGAGPHRLRLSLRQDGACALQTALLTPVAGPVDVFLAPQPCAIAQPFLRHKTSLRADYDAGWRGAEARGGFDTLFFNARGELTEGGRSNVFVRLDGRWVTPPLSAGVLPGVMRAVLLDDPAWQASERSLRREDLLRAEAVVVCNALRGALPARLVPD